MGSRCGAYQSLEGKEAGAVICIDPVLSATTNEKVKVAILAVPEEACFNMAEKLRALGIRGILNFAPVPLKSTPDCNIENMNIALEVEKLFFFISLADRQRDQDTPTL